MNVLLLTSHSIAEHDDLDMFTRMGVNVFSIGAYTNPHHPTDDKRPALPGATHWTELQAAVDRHRARVESEMGAPGPYIDWAKAILAPEVLDWADTIIVHHFPERWIASPWTRIRGKRVIWRTCGQSNPQLEALMARYVAQGLQVVRYSPREQPAFEAWGHFAGQDALIRFGKDPDEWTGWTGEGRWVANVTQNMAQRGDACGFRFWVGATAGLDARPAGPGSEMMDGGLGGFGYDAMRQYLRDARVYLYTGTQPASYTLGLIEAMMTGTPVVSIGPRAFGPGSLFEGHELAGIWSDDPADAGQSLRDLLADDGYAAVASERARQRAIDLFGLDGVMRQWADFLGVTVKSQAVAA